MTRKIPTVGIMTADQGHEMVTRAAETIMYFYRIPTIRITPKHPTPLEKVTGLIFLGGEDIHPRFYGESKTSPEPHDEPRDELEYRYMNEAIAQKIPTLAICRGMQMLNVVCGGNLHQDITGMFNGFRPTQTAFSRTFYRRRVFVFPFSQLGRSLGNRTAYRVNSLHHQAVAELGKNLFISARENSGLVQGIEAHKRLTHPYLVGVQWHPELMLHHPTSRNLFGTLVRRVREKAM